MLEGVIYKYEPGNETQLSWTKVKQVPSDRVVATFEGSWMKQIRYKLKGEKVRYLASSRQSLISHRNLGS